MIIERGNLWCRLASSTTPEYEWLSEYLTFPDAAARYKAKPAPIEMLTRHSCFPSGLLALVRKAASRDGKEIMLRDLRRIPQHDDAADLAWLYPYQREAIEAVVRHKTGLIDIPTGGGKGELVVALARAVPVRWLFVVHTTQLVEQTADRFDARNREHGIDVAPAGRFAAGKRLDSTSMVFATYQTLKALLEREPLRMKAWLAGFVGVVADEAHTTAAQSFWKIMMSLKNAVYRVGLSGTPLQRGDRRSIYTIACLGPVIYKVQATELIELGKVAKPTINMVRCNQPARSWDDYASMYQHRVANSKMRNALAVKIAKQSEKPMLVFVRDVSHGKKVCDALLRAGVPADFVHGKHSVAWRMARIRDLVKGKIEVLVATVIFQAGIDIPELLAALNLTGSKSVIATLQFLGRAMRATDSAGNVTKSTFTYWDIWDNDHQARDDDWLRDASADRRIAYLKAGHQVEIVELP